VNTSTDFFKIKDIGTGQLECRCRDVLTRVSSENTAFAVNFRRDTALHFHRLHVRISDTEEGSCPSNASLAKRASFSTSISVLLARPDSQLISDLWHRQG